jgi:phosphatidate phosphatase APP1
VGDAGERDPEIFARLARRNPEQIVRIVIRDMTGATAQAQRYEILKRDLSVDLWWVFNDAGKLTNAWPTLSQGRN